MNDSQQLTGRDGGVMRPDGDAMAALHRRRLSDATKL
jgi:hypothetical protein